MINVVLSNIYNKLTQVTGTNPGPISYGTISLQHHVTRDEDERKFLNIYCQDGFVPLNLSIIMDVSATIKDCFSSICTCDIFSSCCSSIILPEYEVETLSYIKILLSEGSVDIQSTEVRSKVLQCLSDLKCDLDVLNTGWDHSSEIQTLSSVSMASTVNFSVNSNTDTTRAINIADSSSSHLVPPFQVEPGYYCRFHCGFRSLTKNMLKKHYKRNTCEDLEKHGESGSQSQQALDASDTQVLYSVSNNVNSHVFTLFTGSFCAWFYFSCFVLSLFLYSIVVFICGQRFLVFYVSVPWLPI